MRYTYHVSHQRVSLIIASFLSSERNFLITGSSCSHTQFGLLNNERNLLKSFSVWGRRVVVLANEASNFVKNSVLSGALSENSSGCRLVTIPLWVWYTIELGRSFFWLGSINNNLAELNNIWVYFNALSAKRTSLKVIMYSTTTVP